MLDAVIFDFDGVIVDSEPLHWRAFQRVLAPLGFSFTWEEYLHQYVGLDDRGAFRAVFRSKNKSLDSHSLSDLIVAKAEAFQQEIARGVSPYPGVLELISEAAQSGPIALCSGALRSDILPVLEGLGIREFFPVLVSAEEVSVSKPDPESYRLTLHLLRAMYPELKFRPEACLAIEDTPAGIASAGGAGLPVLAVTNNFPADKLNRATRVMSSLEGITWSNLCSIVERRQREENIR